MNLVKNLKKQYGGRYCYRKYLTDREISELVVSDFSEMPDTTVASLEVGCMRLDAVLYHALTGIETGYDILVKDAPCSLEWICYDAIPANGTKETAMAAALDEYVRERGLSYIDCAFIRLGGKTVASKKKPV